MSVCVLCSKDTHESDQIGLVDLSLCCVVSHVSKTQSLFSLSVCQSWLVKQTTVYGMKLPSRFQLIGQVGLEEYRRGVQWFEESQMSSRTKAEPTTYRCYAR